MYPFPGDPTGAGKASRLIFHGCRGLPTTQNPEERRGAPLQRPLSWGKCTGFREHPLARAKIKSIDTIADSGIHVNSESDTPARRKDAPARSACGLREGLGVAGAGKSAGCGCPSNKLLPQKPPGLLPPFHPCLPPQACFPGRNPCSTANPDRPPRSGPPSVSPLPRHPRRPPP